MSVRRSSGADPGVHGAPGDRSPHVCMIAAENDLVPGGKVGGIGDVIRGLPPALALEGVEVSVLLPSYGILHERSGGRVLRAFSTPFGGNLERIELYELDELSRPGVRQYVLHHPAFEVGGRGVVYCNDPPDRPFARDATKFALFSAAALAAVAGGHVGAVDVLHLHDWHAAFAAILLEFDPEFAALRSLRTVYAIHNLALQGIRPFGGDPSSLESWFPRLGYDPAALSDPRWDDCVNPAAAAIRLCDAVHTVSPTYAREILRPNAPERGFHGGEGLERDLAAVHRDRRLVGIVNGIAESGGEVSATQIDDERQTARETLAAALGDALLATLGDADELTAADYLAHQTLLRWTKEAPPAHILTSVGRLTEQKVALLLHRLPGDGDEARAEGRERGERLVLDILLERLAGRGVLVLLGTGDAGLERACQRLAARHPNFCFIRRFSASLSTLLFAHGDLFLMPSSFEPCGITQMYAMRAGQPPLVHAVGGLADTVEDGVDGFAFTGDSIDAQARALLARVDDALALREGDRTAWNDIVDAARARRFPWRESAKRYIDELYSQ